MKLLILNNNQNWSTWDSKLKQLKDWFAPSLTLDITLEQTHFNNIEWSSDIDSNGNLFQAPNPVWFDMNISIPAKVAGYDAVLFVIEPSVWRGAQVQGLGTKPNIGIEEMCMVGNENAEYVFNGKPYAGGQFFNIARHELCHRIYNILKKTDNTHLYWNNGNLEQCLSELKMPKYKYFSEKEVKGLKPELVKKLDEARGLASCPFIITSGFRTKEQNDKAGGVSESAHLEGLACDIKCIDSVSRLKILKALLQVGFTRIGLGATFLHCDLSTTLPQNCCWNYYK